MNYCSHCGEPVLVRVPPGDNLPRHVCDHCGTVHYHNPKIVAGCVAEWRGRVLLCRRAIEPRYGLWTLPAGFMENAETAAEAATRETHEEAGAQVRDVNLYGLFSLPHINQVYLMFRAELPEGEATPGAESLEVGLFAPAEVPWDAIAFPVVRETLELYFADRRAGRFPVHVGDILRGPDDRLELRRY